MNIIGLDLSAIDTTEVFKLGTIAGNIGAEGPQKLYNYIKYEAATAAVAGVAGEVVGYATVAVGDATSTIVTSDVSDCDTNPIGAGVLQASLTDGTYGWIQVKGPATLSIALTAGVDGDRLTMLGAGDGTLDLSALHTDNVCAIAVDSTAKIIMCCFPH